MGSERAQEKEIIVKFMSRGLRAGRAPNLFMRQFPNLHPVWGKCYFEFDPEAREYDWLVVYHDIPLDGKKRVQQELNCPRERTMLVTTEPSTVTVYGADYLAQYGTIITFQEPWAMDHPHIIHRSPGLVWYYGYDFDRASYRSHDEISSEGVNKTGLISTVCSSKKGLITLHTKRVDFTAKLKEDIPGLELFGRGVREMADKADALQPYRYHVVVENHVAPHHITEKLPDAFLGYTLPFYHGAPNTADYFPKESFIPIDINDYERTVDIIHSVLNNNEYEDRLPYIKEARRIVLEEFNLFAVLSEEIEKLLPRTSSKGAGGVIMNRQSLRLAKPMAGLRSIRERIAVKSKHLLKSS